MPDQPTAPNVASQWLTFTPEKRKELLGKMNADQKKNLRTYLEQSGHKAEPGQTGLPSAIAAPGAATDYLNDLKGQGLPAPAFVRPKNARFSFLPDWFYQLAPGMIQTLPVAGAGIGATAAGLPSGGAGAIAGGALGAMAGERLEQPAYRFLYRDLPAETPREMGTKMLEAGKSGVEQEMLGPITGKIFDKTLGPLERYFSEPARRTAEAEAGTGIRLTPGEAANKPVAKTGEAVLEHWPGSAGPIEKFREQQRADVTRYLQQKLQDISARKLTGEEAGREIQKAFVQAKAKADPVFAQQLDSIQADLHQNLESEFDRRLDALSPQASPREQVGQTIQQRFREQQNELENTTKQRVSEIRAGQNNDVQKVLSRELNALSPRQLTSEESGQQVQGVIRDEQRQSEAAINAKYGEVRKLLGMEPGGYIAKKEIEAAAEEVPEAKAKLDEADLLFKQEKARFEVPIIKKVLTTTKPEDISDILATASLDDLKQLKGYLENADKVRIKENKPPLNALRGAARELYDSMVYKATDPRTGVVNPQTLANSLKALGEERGRIIFGPQYTTIANSVGTIDGINAAAERTIERYRETQTPELHKQDLFKKIAATNKPEELAGLVQKAGTAEVRQTILSLPPEMQQSLRRNVLESMVNRARDAETGMIDARKFANEMKKLGTEKGQAVFGAEYDNIVQTGKKATALSDVSEARSKEIKGRSAKLTTDLVSDILKTNNPEEIGPLLENAGLQDLRELYTHLSPEQQQIAKRNVLENMFNRARDAQNGSFNAGNFSESIKKLEQREGRGRLLFGSSWDDVLEARDLLNRIQRSSSESAGRFHIAGIIGKAIYPASALLALKLGGAGTAAGTLALEYTLSKAIAKGLITNPQTAASTLRVLRMAAATAVRSAPFEVDQYRTREVNH